MLDLADSSSFVGLGQLLVDYTAGSFFAFDLANYYLKLLITYYMVLCLLDLSYVSLLDLALQYGMLYA